MASVMRKGTFGHMQKVKTQTSRCVSDAVSDQGLHFLTFVRSMALIFSCCVINFINYRCSPHRIGTDLDLHYVKCPKVSSRVTLAIYICVQVFQYLDMRACILT